jgi:hypothetical protein
VIKLLCRIVFGSMSIGCSCLQFVTLCSAFCGLGVKLKLGCLMAQSMMMCLSEGVFHL